MLFLVFVFAFSSVRCGFVGENYIIDRPDNDAPRAATTPFKVYWNVPTKQCRSKGIPFDELLRKFKITYNKNDRFEGETITIIYKTGLVPSVLKSNGAKFSVLNGGVPQEGNLEQHLAALRENVARLIPDPDFNGVGVLDLEEWRPIFRQHWSAQASIIDLSLSIEMRKYWWWPTKWQKLEAAKRFEDAARIFMEKTLSTAKQMRPKAVWGYYAFPYCFNMEGSNRGFEHCSKDVKAENDRIYWLWAESTALYPSLYCKSFLSTSEIEKLVSGRLTEANRVKGNGDLVLPYFALTYRDGPFYKESDVSATFNILQKKGASGLIIWGASNDVNTVDKCNELYDYVNKSFGPIAQTYIEKINKMRDINDTKKLQPNKYSFDYGDIYKNTNETFNLSASLDNAKSEILLTKNSTQKHIETNTVQATINVTKLVNISDQEEKLNKYYYDISVNKTNPKSSNETEFWSMIPFEQSVTRELYSTSNTSTHDKNAVTVSKEIVTNSSTNTSQNNILDIHLQLVLKEEQNTTNSLYPTIEATESIFNTLVVDYTSSENTLVNDTEKSVSIPEYTLVPGNDLKDISQYDSQEKQLIENTTITKHRGKIDDSDNLIILADFITPNNVTEKLTEKVKSASELASNENSTYLFSKETGSEVNDVDDYLIKLEVDFTNPKNNLLNRYDSEMHFKNNDSASNSEFTLLPINYISSNDSHGEQFNQSIANPEDSEESDDTNRFRSSPINGLKDILQDLNKNNISLNSSYLAYEEGNNVNNYLITSSVEFNNSYRNDSDNFTTVSIDFTSPKATIMNGNNTNIDAANFKYIVSPEVSLSSHLNNSKDIPENIFDEIFTQNSMSLNTIPANRENAVEDYLIRLIEDFSSSNNTLQNSSDSKINQENIESVENLELTLQTNHTSNNNSQNINKDEENFTQQNKTYYFNTNTIDGGENHDSDNLIIIAVDYFSPKNTSVNDNTEVFIKDVKTDSGLEFTGLPPNYISNDNSEDVKQGANFTENTNLTQTRTSDSAESDIFGNYITIDFTTVPLPQNIVTTGSDTIEVETVKSDSSLEFKRLD